MGRTKLRESRTNDNDSFFAILGSAITGSPKHALHVFYLKSSITKLTHRPSLCRALLLSLISPCGNGEVGVSKIISYF